MLDILTEIFLLGTIERDETGERVGLDSNISIPHGLFLQNLYDRVKPRKSLEVGLAFGISTLFILEKCRENGAAPKSHIVIEPWLRDDVAMHNIRSAGLEDYLDLRNDLSDVVIPSLYLDHERIQFAFVDTTKVFDIVLQDFYFIDKILDIGGVVIFDDASTGGINLVMRFIATLPHYEIYDTFEKVKVSARYTTGLRLFEIGTNLLPFKKKYMNFYSFKTSTQLGLNYRSIAFRKIAKDTRNWDWMKPL